MREKYLIVDFDKNFLFLVISQYFKIHFKDNEKFNFLKNDPLKPSPSNKKIQQYIYFLYFLSIQQQIKA